MQNKKNLPDTSSSSAWQENIKKQQRQNSAKKYGIWAVIIAISLLAFGALVFMVNKSSTPNVAAGKVEPNLRKVSSTDIIVGDKNAKVTIVEYGDLQCPACAAYNPVVNQVLDNYKGKVRLVFRYFPLVGVHKNALPGAEASYAAWKLGKFPEMKDMLFDKQTDWAELSDPRPTYDGYAKSIGLDVNKFNEIMNSDEAKNVVNSGEKESLGLGLNSTPTFFLDGKLIIPQSYDEFKTLIDQELKK